MQRSCGRHQPAATHQATGGLKRCTQLSCRPWPFEPRFAPDPRRLDSTAIRFHLNRERHFDLLYLAILKFENQFAPTAISWRPARREAQSRGQLPWRSLVTGRGDELDAVPVWQSIGRNRAPGYEPGMWRCHEAVCGVKPWWNKERVMAASSNPNVSEPARRSDLVGRCLLAGMSNGNRQPSAEPRLIAEQAPQAERHARAPDEGLVHLLSRTAFSRQRTSGAWRFALSRTAGVRVAQPSLQGVKPSAQGECKPRPTGSSVSRRWRGRCHR